MKSISVLIIEDEKPAQRILQNMLSQLAYEVQVVGCLGSIASSLRWFKENPNPDLVLMDIQLSDGISFKIFEQITIESLIIFITAYDEYAIQAFKVNSLDYLLKPIEKKDLEAAFCKFENYHRKLLKHLNAGIQSLDIASMINRTEPQYRKRFLVQAGEDYFQLPVEKVAFYHSLNKITFAVLFDQMSYGLKYSLESLTDQLEPDRFFKVNRQLIINIDAIQRIQPYFQGKLIIKSNPAHCEEIVVGKDKAASFKRWLDR